MQPGLRRHKSASLRVSIAQALPVEMWEQTRELIAVQSGNRGRGEASALLHQVCAEADRAWLTLILKPEPFAPGLEQAQLEKFYSRFGFVEIQHEPCLMSRAPRRPEFDSWH